MNETPATTPQFSVPTLTEIADRLHALQEKAADIETYLPGQLPEKEQKVAEWNKQLHRASSCVELIKRIPTEDQQKLELRRLLEQATNALDFTREYTVKVIGHAGAGKSTLLAALLNQDIFPRGSGGAVTPIPIRVRMCSQSEPEVMHVCFLKSADFEALLKQTRDELSQPSLSPRLKKELEREVQVLEQAKERYGNEYIKEESFIQEFARDRWKEKEVRDLITEPNRDSKEPHLVRLVDYAEFNVHPGSNSLLPPKSVLVDLPGGAARLRHDIILAKELNTVDAVMLVVGNNRFGDDDRTTRIFEIVNQKVVEGRAPEVAARMVFLAVTHWDEIHGQDDLNRAVGSLTPLLENLDLELHYSSYHKPSQNRYYKYFFYPLRAVDALFATLGLSDEPSANGIQLDGNFRGEGQKYAGDILSVYSELKEIDLALSGKPTAMNFQEVTREQHKAMLRYSGLPDLTNDLKDFLTKNRYDVQLQQARTQLAMALQQINVLAWARLEQLDIFPRTYAFEELQEIMQDRQQNRESDYDKEFEKRKKAMEVAWNKALDQFDEHLQGVENDFRKALVTAHAKAAGYVEKRIDNHFFDRYIFGNNRTQGNLDLEEDWIDAAVRGLIQELRVIFSAAIEQEITQPARVLANTFLRYVSARERDGELDINKVIMDEPIDELVQLQQAYDKIKRGILIKAQNICLYVTMSELVDEKYKLKQDEPPVTTIYEHVQHPPEPKSSFHATIHQDMKKLIDAIQGKSQHAREGDTKSQVEHSSLVTDTERRITLLFRYELQKLIEVKVYSYNRLDASATKPGEFADLAERVRSVMVKHISKSTALREKLDTLLSPNESEISLWYKLLENIHQLEGSVLQTGPLPFEPQIVS